MTQIIRNSVQTVGVGQSTVINVIPSPSGLCQIGLGLVKNSGAIVATVQYTFDDPANITNWFDHPDMNALTGAASDVMSGNIAYPCTAIRLSNAGAGTCTLYTAQFV